MIVVSPTLINMEVKIGKLPIITKATRQPCNPKIVAWDMGVPIIATAIMPKVTHS
jgi:hypothetical protein